MKQLLLFGCLLTAVMMNAQEDARYLAGAVPVENGKVVFSRGFETPSLSKTQLFDLSRTWLNEQANDENKRVVYSDESTGALVLVGKEYIVFSSSLLSLDRSLMSYRITIECKDESCEISISGIRYEYNVSYQRDPERYTAEEWITDENALSKGKLLRIPGKFRKGTIDFVDATFEKFDNMLLKHLPVRIEMQAAPVAQPSSEKEGFVSMSAGQIPSSIVEMLPASRLQLSTKTMKEIDTKGITWKGISRMFGKSVAQVTISKDSPAYTLIEEGEPFTLSFLKNANDTTPWFIMECKKEGETVEESSKTILGEITQVWIK